MSTPYKTVLAFFQERFPDANEEVFKMVAANRLQRLGIKESIEQIDEKTAAKLLNYLKTLSEKELQELTYNAVSQTV